MPKTIECFKCHKCDKLIPREEHDYLILSGLKLVSHQRRKIYMDTYYDRLIIDFNLQDEKEKLFCSVHCINLFVLNLITQS